MILCKAEFAKLIDSAIFPGTQGWPLMHIIAAKAVSFQEIINNEFKTYQKHILKCRSSCEIFDEFGFKLVSGGTDNHLMLLDLSNTSITGKQAQYDA